MDRIDQHFSALSQRMQRLPVPDHICAPQTIASLIDRVNAAKRFYQPGMLR